MSDDHDAIRRLLGGYLLGGLDDADTDRVDSHLRDCDECRLELERLAAVPELLQRLPDTQRPTETGAAALPLIGTAKPTAERIEELLRKMRAERSRDRRLARVRWLVAAAVVVIAAAVGIAVITDDQDRGRSPQVLPSPQLVTAQFESAAGSGLSGEAALTPKTWGVAVSLDVRRLPGVGPYVCQIRDRGGAVEQAAIWGSTPSGSAKVTGASSIQLRNVRSVAVTDRQGRVLGTAELP